MTCNLATVSRTADLQTIIQFDGNVFLSGNPTQLVASIQGIEVSSIHTWNVNFNDQCVARVSHALSS